MSRVAVFGLGYVGCVTAACLSKDGHSVVGVDIDASKVESVTRGTPPVCEPGLEELLSEQAKSGRLSATQDIQKAIQCTDIAIVAVGTPSDRDGSVRTCAAERVVDEIGAALACLKKPYTIVVRSTLLPGILENTLLPILRQRLGDAVGTDVLICNNPEFLRETTAIEDYYDPPFVLIGANDQRAVEIVSDLYAKLAAPHIVADTRTSAMVKYACNAFHALKVAFANEIGTLAQFLGADGQQVMQIVCKDRRLNISPAYLRPGFAFGGSCLPKDIRALTRFSEAHAVATELLRSIIPSNETHIGRALRLIKDSGVRRIGLVGLSFKAGTDDLRESPFVVLAETLIGQGYDLKIYDPAVRITQLTGSNLNYIDKHLKHLAGLLVDGPALLAHAELVVVGTGVGDDLDVGLSGAKVIDLRSDLVVPRREPAIK